MSSSSPTTREGRADDPSERVRCVVHELVVRRMAGEQVPDAQILILHPELCPELERELRKLAHIQQALEQLEESEYLLAWQRLAADWQAQQRHLVATDAGPPDAATDVAELEDPERIGRYRVVGLLGEGGFGRVYLARDDELQREVAIKVPNARRVGSPLEADEYLAEARVVAQLDHPAIVPVYDVGRTEIGDCYVVHKLIRGTDLAARLEQEPLVPVEAVQIAIPVAEALHHAHAHGLVHRDVKPSNILLAADQVPYVTDFGLALRDDETGPRRSFAGTPAYMSPEQARGEAHRVDGRSDVFSLGIVLYEMLAGQKPFAAASYDQLRERIVWEQPVPPRYLNSRIDEELERICLKALAKRATDRYATARLLADDLRYWLEARERSRPAPGWTAPGADIAAASGPARRDTPRIIPKGLRPFDAADADSFVPLLPGPRDRDGLPESIRQWIRGIEGSEFEDTFSVGLMYGPSGCGKSSLVRAGLLPRLAVRVRALYLEATPEETEERLRGRIRQQWHLESTNSSLAECLADIRRGQVLAEGEKLLIVIDQFEQWLHGKSEMQRRELLTALRQCDGTRVQCMLLVRDDFWLAAGRFMTELEVDLVPGRNVALVDLFDLEHARRVLAEFGRAHGRLPDDLSQLGAPEKIFLQRAVAALAQEDRVVPVRLALFAEMVKSRQWKPATLREVGGAEGVGVTFLEETFCARTANPQHRRHERAARAVLAALLPEPGSPIRNRMRAASELLDVSGYGNQPTEYRDLMRILDGETRLLTPMDPDVFSTGQRQVTGERYYQLAHDYLVSSLRSWLGDKEQASRRGRARLRLAERTALWNTRRERRQLPSIAEWLSIRLLTRPAEWTLAQRDMMRTTVRSHAKWMILLAALALVMLYSGVEVTAVARNVLLKLRARTASIWMTLGLQDDVWPLLARSDDPAIRTEIIHGLKPLATGPDIIVDQLAQHEDSVVRSGMLLLAGQLAGDPAELPPRQSELRRNEPYIADLLRLYADDPDTGVHSAARWALCQLGLGAELARLDEELKSAGPRGNRLWFINPQGHTMLVISGPTSFVLGEEDAEAGRPAADSVARRTVWIRRSFCIASTETTRGQFQRFLRDTPALAPAYPDPQAGSGSLPQTGVSWYDAAAYCNWLSQQAGLLRDQWCYEPNEDGQYAAGMTIVPSFFERHGYRLPTEPEWEYACRAGTATVRFFGSSPRYLDHYATYLANASGNPTPVALHKPNDLGLFDTLGNAAEWCQSPVDEDPGGGHRVLPSRSCPTRGGSFRGESQQLRSGARTLVPPATRSDVTGFRVVRSYP